MNFINQIKGQVTLSRVTTPSHHLTSKYALDLSTPSFLHKSALSGHTTVVGASIHNNHVTTHEMNIRKGEFPIVKPIAPIPNVQKANESNNPQTGKDRQGFQREERISDEEISTKKIKYHNNDTEHITIITEKAPKSSLVTPNTTTIQQPIKRASPMRLQLPMLDEIIKANPQSKFHQSTSSENDH